MRLDSETLETIEREDGLKRWLLLRRPTGLYAYEEKTLEPDVYWVDEDGGERDIAADAYWTPTHISGLYDTAEAARADALITLSWLQEEP